MRKAIAGLAIVAALGLSACGNPFDGHWACPSGYVLETSDGEHECEPDRNGNGRDDENDNPSIEDEFGGYPEVEPHWVSE